jgi:aromatic-L-amino-acid decarboxylase
MAYAALPRVVNVGVGNDATLVHNRAVTPSEFRRLGHSLVDWIADYRERISTLPVLARTAPNAVRSALPTTPPRDGGTLGSIADDLVRVVLPGITHWAHPHFYAYFPSNSSLASVLAELVTAGLGVQAMSWQTSPAATEIEEVMMDWLRQMLDLPTTFTGVIQDTASSSTLIALLCARERMTGYAQERDGTVGSSPLAVYASDQAHSSVEKAALLAGFGRRYVRFIESDHAHAMRADRLRDAVMGDRAAGIRPCAVVATVGTTATTAVDPIDAIADVARAEGLWLHVDAALAGSAMILPECRVHWRGVEHADSVVLNPHKWLGTTFDLSAYYVRDPIHLVRVMSTNPSYLRTNADGSVRNLRDWGIPLGRRFRALKLWFLLRDQGVSGLQTRLRRDLSNAAWLKEQVDRASGWECAAPVPFQTVCVRHVPEGMHEPDAVDAHNLAWAERINQSGEAYLTPTVLKGRQIVRVSIGAEATELRDVVTLWDQMQREAVAQDVPRG